MLLLLLQLDCVEVLRHGISEAFKIVPLALVIETAQTFLDILVLFPLDVANAQRVEKLLFVVGLFPWLCLYHG